MTNTEMDKAVAKIMGATDIFDGSFLAIWPKETLPVFNSLRLYCQWSREHADKLCATIPSFSQSLDASRWAVMTLSAELVMDDKAGMLTSERVQYMNLLERIVMRDTKVSACNFEFYNATAPQRTEAFLMVHGVLPKIL